jgi:hypothetical protein
MTIILEMQVDEPAATPQDQILLMEAWSEHTAREAMLANAAHAKAQSELMEMKKSLRLPSCDDEEL